MLPPFRNTDQSQSGLLNPKGAGLKTIGDVLRNITPKRDHRLEKREILVLTQDGKTHNASMTSGTSNVSKPVARNSGGLEQIGILWANAQINDSPKNRLEPLQSRPNGQTRLRRVRALDVLQIRSTSTNFKEGE